jgi:hypothetical protein
LPLRQPSLIKTAGTAEAMTPVATGQIWLRYGIVHPFERDGDGHGRHHLGHRPRRLLASDSLQMREPGQL